MRWLFPKALLVSDPLKLAERDDVDLIVEVMGGCGVARQLHPFLASRRQTRSDSQQGGARRARARPFRRKRQAQRADLFRSEHQPQHAVIQALREGFAINQFHLIYGIVNGTCNYILHTDDPGQDEL